KHQAGPYRLIVHDHGASAANSMFAANMRTCLAAVLADRVSQRAPRLDADRVVATVNIERDCALLAHAAFSALRMAARMRCGVAGISLISMPKGDKASLIALMTAAGAPIAPPSPSPLAFVMEFGLGVSIW